MVKTWLLAFRPKTLTAAVVPVFVGTALLAVSSAPIRWWITFCALAGALFIQIGTNLINDALDFKKGADTEERLGPKRVTQSGLLSAEQVLRMGYASFALAFLFGIPLVMHGGWVIVAIGLISLFCGYAYTGGPFPLAYRGMGDLFVILFFGLVAVGGVYYLHTGAFHLDAAVAGLQVGFLCTVLIAINNLRDIDGDRKVNKKTLAVRFGKGFVRLEILVLSFLPFLLSFYWWRRGYFWPAVLPFLILPMAGRLVRAVMTEEPGEIYNEFLAQAAKVHVFFGILFSLGFFMQ